MRLQTILVLRHFPDRVRRYLLDSGTRQKIYTSPVNTWGVLTVLENTLSSSSSPDQSWTTDPANRTSSSDIPMSADPSIVGRTERRLPVIVVVSLTRAERQDTNEDKSEKTYTDNISLHGARVFSRFRREPGEMVQVTPLNYDCVCGKVVYCQRLPDGRHAIGVNFQDRAISWSILQRFGGA